MKYSKEEVLQYMREEDVKFIRLAFCDVFGRQKNISIMPQELPRASVIVYNERFRQVWSYGDCQCLINGVLHSHSKPVDRLAADLRAFVLEYERLQGKTEEALFAEDPGRAAIGPLLRMQLAFENHPGP